MKKSTFAKSLICSLLTCIIVSFILYNLSTDYDQRSEDLVIQYNHLLDTQKELREDPLRNITVQNTHPFFVIDRQDIYLDLIKEDNLVPQELTFKLLPITFYHLYRGHNILGITSIANPKSSILSVDIINPYYIQVVLLHNDILVDEILEVDYDYGLIRMKRLVSKERL